MTVDKLLQKVLIRILNPIYSVTRHIDKRVQDMIVFVLIFCLVFFINATRSPMLRDQYIYEFIVSGLSRYRFCTLLFVLLILFSVDRVLKETEWRKGVFYIGFVLGLAIIIVSFIHPVGDGYRLFGFQIAFIFPAFYLVWNNRRDYDVLFRHCSYAMIIVGLIFFFITFAVAIRGEMIIEGARCSGIMGNANCFSLMGLEMYLSAVYLALTENRSLSRVIIWSIAVGIGMGIMFLGQMRIAILAVLISTVFAIFFKRRYFRESIDKKRLMLWLVSFAIIINSIIPTYALVDINNSNPTIANSENTAIESNTDVLDRFIVNEDKGVEGYSSGRIWIWKNYAKHLNLFGNNYDDFDKEEMTGPHVGYAHNVFLEMGYRYGVLIAVGYLLYMMICGIVCLFYLFAGKKAKERYLLFPIIAAIVFVLESLLDCALLPFFQPEAMMYYISIAAVIDGKIHSRCVESKDQQAYNVPRLSEQN